MLNPSTTVFYLKKKKKQNNINTNNAILPKISVNKKRILMFSRSRLNAMQILKFHLLHDL